LLQELSVGLPLTLSTREAGGQERVLWSERAACDEMRQRIMLLNQE